jgi:membrane protein implicated in regulation of membrane protease activity
LLQCNKRHRPALALATTLLLAGLLLPAMLAALTRILGLLAGLALSTLLTTLVRVVLALLILVALVRHILRSLNAPRADENAHRARPFREPDEA